MVVLTLGVSFTTPSSLYSIIKGNSQTSLNSLAYNDTVWQDYGIINSSFLSIFVNFAYEYCVYDILQ